MAQNVQLPGAQVTKRSPWGVWGLSLITFGIYGLVWWHRINREMRDVSAGVGQPFDNDPNKAVLALFPGGILIVPAILTWLHTARRVNAGGARFETITPSAISPQRRSAWSPIAAVRIGTLGRRGVSSSWMPSAENILPA